MSERAKKHWRPLVRLLDAIGVLTRADLVLVERYCETLVLWRDCRDFIADKGMVYPLKKWNPHKSNGKKRRGGFEVVGFKEFPQVKTLRQLDATLLRHDRELGLTPSARTRLVADNPAMPGRPPGDAEDRNTAAAFRGPRLRSIAGGKAG